MDSGDGEVWDVVDQDGDDCDCHVADDDHEGRGDVDGENGTKKTATKTNL